MKQFECDRESEALAAALQARWPERMDAELRAHVAGCEICSDVVSIASAIDEARDQARAHAVLPDAGRVWWIAQMRARREAAAAAGRPITAAQVIALAGAAGVLGTCFGATSAWMQSAIGRLASGVAGFRMETLTHAAAGAIGGHAAFAAAIAGVVLLVPTAVYLAVLRD